MTEVRGQTKEGVKESSSPCGAVKYCQAVVK